MEVRNVTGARFRRLLWSTACGIAFLSASAALAGGQRPTPTPVPTRSPSRSLADIAGKIRLKRPGTGTRSVTITNENLSSYAEKGGITTAARPSSKPAPSTGGQVPGGGPGGGRREMGEEHKKQYWRNQYIRQKQLIEDLRRRIDELNSEIPALWNQFYARDDPSYRDGVIKPKIDRKLKEIEELKKRLPQEEKKLSEILEKARRDGALPGWFRDLT